MVVETSVLVAIGLQEPAFEDLVFQIAESQARSISAANYLEASLVLFQRRGEAALLELDKLIAEMEIAIVSVTVVQVRIARGAFLAYGKGLGNSAQLNSILEIGLGIRWRSRLESRCCSRGMISFIRTC